MSTDTTRAKVSRFMALDDDWDGAGASAASPVSIETVFAILAQVDDEGLTNIPVDAAMCPDGGVLIEWRTDCHRLHLIVDPVGAISGFTGDVVNGKTTNRSRVAPSSIEDVLSRVRAMEAQR